jgi:hypothetical protein
MKIRLKALKRIIKEEGTGMAVSPPQGGTGLGKLLDDVAMQFSTKMQAQFPDAGDVIQREASDLKTQLTAIIKSAAAKVKMSASKPS